MVTTLEPSKSEQCTKHAEGNIVSHYNQFNHRVKRFRTDHEATLVAASDYFKDHGIIFDASVPGRHQTLVERSIQTLSKKMQSREAGLSYIPPEKLDGELIHHAPTLLNMTLNVKTTPLTPKFMVERIKPTAPQHA